MHLCVSYELWALSVSKSGISGRNTSESVVKGSLTIRVKLKALTVGATFGSRTSAASALRRRLDSPSGTYDANIFVH